MFKAAYLKANDFFKNLRVRIGQGASLAFVEVIILIGNRFFYILELA
jgi:hypothetical protein